MHTNRTRTSKLLLSASAVAGLALVASGCGESPSEFVAEKVIEQQTDGDVDVDFDSGAINVATPDGQLQVDEDGNFTVTDENGEVITGQGDDDGNFTVDGDDGSFTMSQSGDIPDEWPGEIPQPDGVAVSGSSVIDTGQGSGITLAGSVDDAEAFMAQYGGNLEGAGLSKMSEYSNADSASAVYGNDDWTMSIGASKFDDGIQVSITLYPTA
jgi:flagellar basal body rod protein FlgG